MGAQGDPRAAGATRARKGEGGDSDEVSSSRGV